MVSALFAAFASDPREITIRIQANPYQIPVSNFPLASLVSNQLAIVAGWAMATAVL